MIQIQAFVPTVYFAVLKNALVKSRPAHKMQVASFVRRMQYGLRIGLLD